MIAGDWVYLISRGSIEGPKRTAAKLGRSGQDTLVAERLAGLGLNPRLLCPVHGRPVQRLPLCLATISVAPNRPCHHPPTVRPKDARRRLY